MLETTTMMILSMAFITKLKVSWQMSTMLIMMMNLMLMMTIPLTESINLMSTNTMLDTMSMLMLCLSMWIFPLMVLASQYVKMNKMAHNTFLSVLMLLLMTLIMSFSVNSLIMFYLWFESTLVPTLLLIILWGYQPERMKASFYLLLYTITASLPLLMMILKMSATNHCTMLYMMTHHTPKMMNIYITWLMLIMAFMVKLPMFSLHVWLPKAHVEAPVAGSMVLAAILLKLGGYGLARMNMLINKPLFTTSYMFVSIATIGALVTNMLCLRQMDLKALIAYSSIGHMSLLIIGTLSNSKLGQYGSLIIMLTHGLTSSCMFMLSGMMYEMVNSRNIILMSKSMIVAPILTLTWFMVSCANMALPPSLNLIGELAIMMSSFFIMNMMIFMLMLMSMLTAVYSVYLYSMINHGNMLKMNNPHQQLKSINMVSYLSHLWPLLALTMLPSKLMSWC